MAQQEVLVLVQLWNRRPQDHLDNFLPNPVGSVFALAQMTLFLSDHTMSDIVQRDLPFPGAIRHDAAMRRLKLRGGVRDKDLEL